MRSSLRLALLAALGLATLLISGGGALSAHGPTEVEGLHEAPEIPVHTVGLRGPMPDHPSGPWPAPPGPRELKGLRETPNIPVRTIGVRRPMPDHPAGPPGPGSGCNKNVDLTSTISGVVAVAAQDNGICTSADIDTYVRASDIYVVQAGGEQAAWTHTRVTDPSSPLIVGQFVWSGGAGKKTYTPDVKAFRQGDKDYLALSLERFTLNAFCGVVIVDVTDPASPAVRTQIYKNVSSDFWCDVHNSFVEDDIDGNGRYLYLTADARNDMRVLDIANVAGLPNPCDISQASCPIEIGRYTSPTADNDNYVHDVTVINHGGSAGRRAYLAYWDSGVVILNAANVTPGINPAPINVIDPLGFETHHAFASQDGTLVFIQDEFLNSNGQQPVQMFDVSTPASPAFVDGLILGTDIPANPAHNLEIRFDIAASRLYVGWYKLGLQAWDFTSAGFSRPNPAPRTAVQYHQAQTESADDAYDGAWGVRLENIGTNLYIFQSDRRYGLIVDCVGCSTSPTPTPTATATPTPTPKPTATPTPTPTPEGGGTGSIRGTVTDASTGGKLADVTLTTDTGQSATTNRGGKYSLKDVPEGDRSVTASKSGHLSQTQNVTVVAGQMITLDFAPDDPQ